MLDMLSDISAPCFRIIGENNRHQTSGSVNQSNSTRLGGALRNNSFATCQPHFWAAQNDDESNKISAHTAKDSGEFLIASVIYGVWSRPLRAMRLLKYSTSSQD
ncbi:MAG: hypothetical protein M1834_002361 [Cirrosporium novae-zelandiae]|nr:MAG: hypothetical protein M1834_002361 [Cirrosporium novae-zelandiae]